MTQSAAQPAPQPAAPTLNLAADRTQVMGILNLTTDSFSDGGRWLHVADPTSTDDLATALEHAREMVAQGADIIDIGGESTGPGATRVDPEIEYRRVVPATRALAAEGIAVSVDTMRAEVAAAAIEAGAVLINDVSAGLDDPDMFATVANTDAALCLMHWETDRFGDADSNGQRGVSVAQATKASTTPASGSGATPAGTMGAGAAGSSTDVTSPESIVDRVVNHLAARVEAAEAAGISRDRLILDPGLGFAKSADDNWLLLRGLPRLAELGLPILVGASRKRFLTTLVPDPDGTPCLPQDADPATAAISALCAAHGIWGVRVHNVTPTAQAVAVAHAWSAGTGPAIPEGWRARRV